MFEHEYEHPAIESTKDLYRASSDNGTAVVGGHLPLVQPEVEELLEAIESGDMVHVRNEFGDVLFNVIIGGIQSGIEDPLACLQLTVDKNKKRFEYVTAHIKVKKDHFSYRSEVSRLWKKAKELE